MHTQGTPEATSSRFEMREGLVTACVGYFLPHKANGKADACHCGHDHDGGLEECLEGG